MFSIATGSHQPRPASAAATNSFHNHPQQPQPGGAFPASQVQLPGYSLNPAPLLFGGALPGGFIPSAVFTNSSLASAGGATAVVPMDTSDGAVGGGVTGPFADVLSRHTKRWQPKQDSQDSDDCNICLMELGTKDNYDEVRLSFVQEILKFLHLWFFR